MAYVNHGKNWGKNWEILGKTLEKYKEYHGNISGFFFGKA
jgi:hypothetical protein